MLGYGQILTAAVVILGLTSSVVQGDSCPSSASFNPSTPLGSNTTNYVNTYNYGTTLLSAVGSPTSAQQDCCPNGTTVDSWTISVSQTNAVGKIAGNCTDGTNLATLAYGRYNGGSGSCPNNLGASTTVQPGNSSLTAWSASQAPSTLTQLFGVGSTNGSSSVSFSCPSGQNVIGYSASSACTALTNVQIICGSANATSTSASPPRTASPPPPASPPPSPSPPPPSPSPPPPTATPTAAASPPPPPPSTSNAAGSTASGSGSSGSSSSGLSGGAIGGIAAGAAVGVVALLVGAFFLWRRKRGKSSAPDVEKETYPDDKMNVYPLRSVEHGPPASGQSAKSKDSGTDSYYPSGPLPSGLVTVPFSQVLKPASDVAQMRELVPLTGGALRNSQDRGLDKTSFASLPKSWHIPLKNVKLLCTSDGKPVVLGRGGFGVVYHAIVRQEEAAIKIVQGGEPEEQARLLHEITVLEQCKTTNIVQFLGYSICDDGLLLCMEFCAGGTLWHSLRAGDEFQYYNRGRQALQAIAGGLFVLHSQGVAHLDMKSCNVLLTSDGRAKIADLGLGKLMNEQTNMATRQGTFTWTSVEQILHGTCSLASDVWSFSVLIWEVCTVQVPSRAISPADIKVPEQAPMELVFLMRDCRNDDPLKRPSISEVCERLNKMPYRDV